MNNSSIDTGNAAMAKFLEWEFFDELPAVPNFYPFSGYESGYTTMQLSALEFHFNWSWLMPVIEKLAKVKLKYTNSEQEYSPHPTTFGMVDEEGNYMVRIYCSQLFHSPTLIEAAWLAVVDTLEWINKTGDYEEKE